MNVKHYDSSSKLWMLLYKYIRLFCYIMCHETVFQKTLFEWVKNVCLSEIVLHCTLESQKKITVITSLEDFKQRQQLKQVPHITRRLFNDLRIWRLTQTIKKEGREKRWQRLDMIKLLDDKDSMKFNEQLV